MHKPHGVSYDRGCASGESSCTSSAGEAGLVPHREAIHRKDLHAILMKAAVYLYLSGGKGDSKGWQRALWLLLALLYSLLQEHRQRLDTHKQHSLQETRAGA